MLQPLADENALLHVAEPLHARAGAGQRVLGSTKPSIRRAKQLVGGIEPS
jgi:hypothetical protein